MTDFHENPRTVERIVRRATVCVDGRSFFDMKLDVWNGLPVTVQIGADSDISVFGPNQVLIAGGKLGPIFPESFEAGAEEGR